MASVSTTDISHSTLYAQKLHGKIISGKMTDHLGRIVISSLRQATLQTGNFVRKIEPPLN